MTGQQFKIGMDRLIKRYERHSGSYPPEIQKIFWDYVNPLSGDQWSNVVNRLMAYNTFPPMLDKIEAMLPISRLILGSKDIIFI